MTADHAPRSNAKLAEQRPEPIFRVVATSPMILPPQLGVGRVDPATNLRYEAGANHRHGQLLLFDAVVMQSRLLLFGPPLLDHKHELTDAEWRVDGMVVRPHLADVQGTQRSWIDLSGHSAAELEVRFNGVAVSVPTSAARVDWFSERRVLLTKARNCHIESLADWASFYVAHHGVDAVLLYDEGSDRYTSRELLSRLLTVPGLDVAVVVEWPHLGDTDSSSDDGSDEQPTDADISVCGFLEHARRTFLGAAAGVVYQRPTELAISSDDRTVFDHAASAAEGAISFGGRRIENAAASVHNPPGFTDYSFFDIRRRPLSSRWAIAPGRTDESAQWLPDRIAGVAPAHVDTVLYRRFAALTSGTGSAVGPSPIDPSVHALDRELRAVLGGSTVAAFDGPADRAARPRETLSRLATLIDPKVRVRSGFRKLWFYSDSVLTLDYQTPEGIRYAYDLRATERGISLSIAGRDDSSRHSVRKRCGSFGKLVDSNRRLELAWWRHSQPLDATAMDALAHLQRANTAMSLGSLWVPPRSIPSYWWDHRVNFGDLIGPWIVELLTGRPTHNTIGLPNAGDALVGVGSLITSLQRPGTTIWGSGLIGPLDARSRDRLRTRTPRAILAVRGALTRQELVNQLGWDVPEVYGDPALLMSRLYAPSPTPAQDARFSVCPHYIHKRDVAARVGMLDDARLIDVERDAETVVAELATSKAVISTSLHGLIVAQAYGVPWVWLRIGDRQLAGDAFKFEDFFTTLDRDAVASETLTLEELPTADFRAIAKKATLPASRFDETALLDAFPYPIVDRPEPFSLPISAAADGVGSTSIGHGGGTGRPNEEGAGSTQLRGAQEPATKSVVAGPDAADDFRLPVVLISYNRGSMLRKVVDGYQRQTVPVDIFLHDNGSDDPQTRAVLDDLERDGVTVFRRPKISSPEELNLVDETVQKIFRSRPPSPYAVSDCDVSIAESSPTTLQVYLDVLEAMPEVECAGPMLRIDDVPPSYPLYNAMLNRHIGRFWSKEPEWATVKGYRLAFQRAQIDTTLAVYRAGEPFRRLRQGVRLYFPHDARHLDWYPEEHAEAYRASADGSTISNWANPARERANRDVPIKYTSYRTVVEEDGRLVPVTRKIARDTTRIDPDSLLALMEKVRATMSATGAASVGRAWVWRGRAGVLEVNLDADDRMAFDVVPRTTTSWTTFAVARTDGARSHLQAAGLNASADGRFPLDVVSVVDGDLPDATALATAFQSLLERLVR